MRRLTGQLENMVLILLTAFGAVFVAEIVGDKLLYTTGILAARYRTMPIMFGMAVAFMAKMGVAVLVGDAVSKLPRSLVATITALSFLGVAVALWRKSDRPTEAREKHRASKAAAVSFAAIFLSEWGDVGQITAAALTAKYHRPFVIWLGAVAAMITKGALAAFLGGGIRRWIQDRVAPEVVRYLAVSLLLVLGVLSVLEILFEKN
ncbi:MAG: Ca2+/H+ antiporter, family [Blastocatellia bacterium]|nr:Ca2+/H+ antiporter, family [Blastocatellia bacterium]